jgi:hypothetical protein
MRLPPVNHEKMVEFLINDHGLSAEKAELIANHSEGNLDKLEDLEHSMEQRKKFISKWLELRSSNLGEIFSVIQGSFARNPDHAMNFLINWYRDLIRVKLNRKQDFNPDFEFEAKTESEKYSIKEILEGLELLLQLEEEINVYNLTAQTAGEQIFLKLR